MVCRRVTSGREIIVSCMLIVIGAALIAVACRLVVIRPGLVLITCRLVAIRRKVILVTRRVVTAHVAIRALFCLPLRGSPEEVPIVPAASAVGRPFVSVLSAAVSVGAWAG